MTDGNLVEVERIGDYMLTLTENGYYEITLYHRNILEFTDLRFTSEEAYDIYSRLLEELPKKVILGGLKTK